MASLFPAVAIAAQASPPGGGTGVPLTWAQRIAQPGVLMAVQMSSLSEIQSGADIRQPAPGGFVTYDAAKNAMRIDVPASFATPALAWAKSLPYAQQFDAHSEFWVQFDVQWDAGMLTPSNGGGGIKFFTVDEGTQSDGFVSGSCDNGGNFPMEGQIVGTTVWSAAGRFPVLYHSCGFILYPWNTSGVYDGLYDTAPDGDVLMQNKVAGCTYRSDKTACVRFVPDAWHTVTLRAKIGTWYKNDGNLKHDSQIDFWLSRPGLPTTYVVSKKNYDLVNASPGQARYGKLWLLPYDTGRSSSSMDGRVWYRNVLMASQPLKDPLTGVTLVADAPLQPPRPPSNLRVAAEGTLPTIADNQPLKDPLTGVTLVADAPLQPPRPPSNLRVAAGGTLPTIADNGWLAVTPNPSLRYLPGGNPGPGGAVTVPDQPAAQSTPVARGYSGITYGGGMIAYFGGGHSGWPGNDVEVYDIAANVWIQSWKPEVCLNVDQPCGQIYGGSTSPVRTPLNRPYVEHMYQQTIWRPDLNRFELFTRGTGAYLFDPVARTLTPSPVALNPQGWWYPWGSDVAKSHFFWAPDVNDRFIITTAGGPSVGLHRQDPKTLIWSAVAAPPEMTDGGTFYSTYVASQRKHFMMLISGPGLCGRPGCPRRWFWFDARTLMLSPVTLPAGVDVADFVAYDSKNDRLLAIQDSVDPIKLWVGTPDAATWTPLVLTGTPRSNAAQKTLDVRGALPTWQYDPVNNVFWYLGVDFSSGGVNLWAYRYKN